MDGWWSIVAEPRREAARDAVATAFGRTPVERIQPLVAGASATSFRIDVAGRAYALRLEAEPSGIRDPFRTYPCLEAASAAGLTPAVRHLDRAMGVAIVDFHEPVPHADYPGGPLALTAELGRLVARLQALPPFPKWGRIDQVLPLIFDYVRDSKLFAPGLLDAHGEAFGSLAAAYPWGAEPRVASHNDINLNNVIFDGERLWLIDWETAFRNDPFFDLAVVMVESVERLIGEPAPELEPVLLAAWLGRAPDQRALDRLTVMKPIAKFYQLNLLLSMFPERLPPGAPFPDLSGMTRSEFRAALAKGRLRSGTPELPLAYAMVLLPEFLALSAAAETRAAMHRLSTG
jgi:hypothetical protein